MLWLQCFYVFVDGISDIGIVFEGVVDFQEVVIYCMIVIKQYLDDVEFGIYLFQYFVVQDGVRCWDYDWGMFQGGRGQVG